MRCACRMGLDLRSTGNQVQLGANTPSWASGGPLAVIVNQSTTFPWPPRTLFFFALNRVLIADLLVLNWGNQPAGSPSIVHTAPRAHAPRRVVFPGLFGGRLPRHRQDSQHTTG